MRKGGSSVQECRISLSKKTKGSRREGEAVQEAQSSARAVLELEQLAVSCGVTPC